MAKAQLVAKQVHQAKQEQINWSKLQIGSKLDVSKIPVAGRHIRVEVYNVAKELTNDFHRMYQFLKELPAKVDMGALTPPIIVKGIPENPGITGILVIDYSHISFHAFTDKNRINFDLYSCKDFDPEVVIEHAEKSFGVSRDNMIIKEDLRF